MNTGKHKIWICLKNKSIYFKLSDEGIDSLFSVSRPVKIIMKRPRIKKMLSKKIPRLRVKNFVSRFNNLIFSEFIISGELYRLVKDYADREIFEYEQQEEE